MKVTIESMTPDLWSAVRMIYAEGIGTKNATFEEEPPNWATWHSLHMMCCRFVAFQDENVVGWSALSPVSSRCVYAGVAEVSVYVSQKVQGNGIGTKLLRKLIESSEHEGIWTLQAGIFPENKASIHLHKKLGFRIVGTREKLGQMDNFWRDVVLLERRSTIVGAH